MAAINEYGKALFLLSEELSDTEEVLADIRTAEEAFKASPEYVKLLDTPAVAKAEKLALIDEAFSTLNENLVNLIKILCEKHSVREFSDIARTYSALYDESRGILHVEAVTATPMTSAQTEKMAKKLHDMTNKTVIIKNTVSPDIIGGVKVRYEGKQLDGSIKTRLENFEKNLKSLVI